MPLVTPVRAIETMQPESAFPGLSLPASTAYFPSPVRYFHPFRKILSFCGDSRLPMRQAPEGRYYWHPAFFAIFARGTAGDGFKFVPLTIRQKGLTR
jgi:hypothetical protein